MKQHQDKFLERTFFKHLFSKVEFAKSFQSRQNYSHKFECRFDVDFPAFLTRKTSKIDKVTDHRFNSQCSNFKFPTVF